jgi:dihydroxy-acid dehydratase
MNAMDGQPEDDKEINIVHVYEAIGAYTSGKISAEDLKRIEDVACPGPGACAGQFTANTMSTIAAIMGISPMGFNDIPATDGEKEDIAVKTGEMIMHLLENDIRPSQIITRAFARKRDRFGGGYGRKHQCGATHARLCT